MIRRAVVLAAGFGGRLGLLTQARPKCLVPVLGRPLIDYVLQSVRGAGVHEVLFVLGHHGEQVRTQLSDGRYYGLNISYVWNDRYHLGNASSLACALPLIQHEPFLLLMADHLVSASLLRTFLLSCRGSWRSAIAVDRSELGPERAAEATKVATVGGIVRAIGKTLDRWEAADVGASYWVPGSFGSLPAALTDGELSAFVGYIAQAGSLAACDVSGHFWLDVDTEDDLRLAEQLLAADERILA